MGVYGVSIKWTFNKLQLLALLHWLHFSALEDAAGLSACLSSPAGTVIKSNMYNGLPTKRFSE